MLGKLAMLPLLSPILCLHGSDPTLRDFSVAKACKDLLLRSALGPLPQSTMTSLRSRPSHLHGCSELDRGDNRGHSGDVELRVALHGS